MREIVLTGSVHLVGRVSDDTADTVGFAACPFCGLADLKFFDKDLFDSLQKGRMKVSLYVRCNVCEAEMWEHTWAEDNYEKRMRLLAEKWNRRVEA